MGTCVEAESRAAASPEAGSVLPGLRVGTFDLVAPPTPAGSGAAKQVRPLPEAEGGPPAPGDDASFPAGPRLAVERRSGWACGVQALASRAPGRGVWHLSSGLTSIWQRDCSLVHTFRLKHLLPSFQAGRQEVNTSRVGSGRPDLTSLWAAASTEAPSCRRQPWGAGGASCASRCWAF